MIRYFKSGEGVNGIKGFLCWFRFDLWGVWKVVVFMLLILIKILDNKE